MSGSVRRHAQTITSIFLASGVAAASSGAYAQQASSRSVIDADNLRQNLATQKDGSYVQHDRIVVESVDANGNPKPLPGVSGNFAPAQVAVSSAGTLIVSARRGRNSVTVENTSSTAVHIGGPGVKSTTGIILSGVVGASATFTYNGPLYGVTESGSAVLSEVELY